MNVLYSTLIVISSPIFGIYIGNATRLCNANGLWTGGTPQCQPIACGDPVTFPHASVALLNGSTVWKAIAQYACIHGYKEAKGKLLNKRLLCLTQLSVDNTVIQ